MGEDAKVAKDAVEKKRYREFTVTPGLAGFKVRMGCSEVYFGDAAVLSLAIEEYLRDPQKTERRFQNADIRFGMSPEAIGPTAAGNDAGPEAIGGGMVNSLSRSVREA